MSNEKRIADQLDTYLQQPEANRELLDPATRQVTETLLQSAASEQPRPGFINELSQQLRDKDREMNEQPSISGLSRFLRLALGAVALVALFAVAFYATGLFRPLVLEPAVDDSVTREAIEVREPTAGPFAGHQIQVATSLPDETRDVQLFQASAAALPDSIAAAQQFGRELGLQDPVVYEMPQDPGRWIVRDETGASLSFRPEGQARGGMPDGLYYSGFERGPEIEGEPLPFADAERRAIAFLDGANLLPAAYETEEEPFVGDIPLRVVNIIPLLDGLPLESDSMPTQVGVLPDGTIHHAQVRPLVITPLGESVTVKTASQALDDLLQGNGGYSFSYDYDAGDQRQRIFYPPMPASQPGDSVTVDGYLSVLRGLSVNQDLVTLYDPEHGTQIELRNMPAGALAEVSVSAVQVSGTVVETDENGNMILEVQSTQPAEDPPAPQDCRSGVLNREDGRAILQTDDGGRFDLGELDPELAAGERIEVCAVAFTGDEPLAWRHIVSPPSGDLVGGRSGGGGGASGRTVQAVEVTRVVQAESAGGGAASQVAEQVVADSPATDSPYAVGDELDVRGTISGHLRREGGEDVPVLLLAIDEDDDPFTHALHYPLYGEQALLEELSQYYRLHVQVQGTVVEAAGEQRGPGNQAIRITSFRPVVEDAGVEAFLGQIEQRTLEGREVAVFVDSESGTRYVLTQDFGMPDTEGKVWLAGVVHPDAEFAGLPILEPISTRSGSDVDAADSAADLPSEYTTIPVLDTANLPPAASSGLPQNLIIETVSLGYSEDNPASPDGTTLTPVWIFSGRSADGMTTFSLSVPATQ